MEKRTYNPRNAQSRKSPASTSVIGKIQPQARELEEAVLWTS